MASIEEMREELDSDSAISTEYDPEMEAIREEVTGELAEIPQPYDADKPWPQELGESIADAGIQFSSSIPLITPTADKSLAAYYATRGALEHDKNWIEEYGQQQGNIMSAREALMGQAQERSPGTSFISSMAAGLAAPVGGVGIPARMAYESGLSMFDALLRGRTPKQSAAEGATSAVFQGGFSSLPWLRGILPGTSITPDIVNKVAARASSWLTPSNKLDASEIADLYGDVSGRRLVKSYEKGELLRKKGDMSPPMNLIQNTKEVAEELQSAFQSMQRQIGGRYGKIKAEFIAPARYQDFKASLEGIEELQNIGEQIKEMPHLFSGHTKKRVKDALKMFEKGIKTDYPSLKGAKPFPGIDEELDSRLRKLQELFDKSKTGTQRDAIAKQVHKLSQKHAQQMNKSTRIAKETMIQFRQKMDLAIKDLSESRDPNIIMNRGDDIKLLGELRDATRDMLGNKYIKSDDLVKANAEFSAYQDAFEDIYKFLAITGKNRKFGDFKKAQVDPYKLSHGLNTNAKEASDSFWSGINKMKEYITTDDEAIKKAVKEAGLEHALKRMEQLVNVMAKKQQLFKGSTMGGPSSGAINEASKNIMLSSGDNRRVAFSMLTAPITNPYGWTNMIDNFADAFSTKQNRVNPKSLQNWWGKASQKIHRTWPGFGKAKAPEAVTFPSGMRGPEAPGVPPLTYPSSSADPLTFNPMSLVRQADPRSIAGRIAGDPQAAIAKGLTRPLQYRTMPKGDKFVGFDPANTEILPPFPWSENVEQDETAVMPQDVKSDPTN